MEKLQVTRRQFVSKREHREQQVAGGGGRVKMDSEKGLLNSVVDRYKARTTGQFRKLRWN